MKLKHSILPQIEAKLDEMTPNEKKLAHYFLSECNVADDLAANVVATRFNISQATLTRFAQKCGFTGYREFIFSYQAPEKHTLHEDYLSSVFTSYQELLNKTYSLINQEQITRVSVLLGRKKRVYLYGKGSSAMVAREIKLRLMRVGIVCEAVTDDDLLRINHLMLDADCVVIGISISGKTPLITESLCRAKESNASVILLTANHSDIHKKYCDEIVLFAMKNRLNHGRLISPQFPALIVFDIIYSDLMRREGVQRNKIWQRSYKALIQGKT